MATSSSSKPNLWDAALRKLPDKKQTLLRSGLGPTADFQVQALTDVVAQAQERALSSRLMIKTRSGEVAVRDVINKMVFWVNKFIAIGDNAIQYDPAHAALPWAAFRLLLQVHLSPTPFHSTSLAILAPRSVLTLAADFRK